MTDPFHIQVVPARDHHPDQYRDYYEGYRAVELRDERGMERGSIVWRLASGHSVEITECGIHNPNDRRKGRGRTLMDAALEDMQSYFQSIQCKLRRVYLFCEDINHGGRAFYESCGFKPEATLHNFYGDCSAVFYVLELD